MQKCGSTQTEMWTLFQGRDKKRLEGKQGGGGCERRKMRKKGDERGENGRGVSTKLQSQRG